MKKKTKISLAAAGVLGVAVAAALVWNGTRDTGTSLTYDELLALAGDTDAAASVVAELEENSSSSEISAVSQLLQELEADSSSEAQSEAASLIEALADENTSSSTLTELVASIESSRKEEMNGESNTSSQTAGSAVSGASHSTAAPERDYSTSSSAVSSAAHSAAASTSSTASSSKEKTCDEQLADCIKQMEALQAKSEKEVYGIIYDAFDDYMSHPAEERNLTLKISVVLAQSGKLNKAQSKCDKEFKAILTDMRKILKDNGRDQTLADEAEKTYKQKKNAMIKELTNQAYSGGDGSGQSGKWLAEKAGKTS